MVYGNHGLAWAPATLTLGQNGADGGRRNAFNKGEMLTTRMRPLATSVRDKPRSMGPVHRKRTFGIRRRGKLNCFGSPVIIGDLWTAEIG